MNCKQCNQETSNPKFCSRSCAVSFNNSKAPKRKRTRQCKKCTNLARTGSKLCDTHYQKRAQFRDRDSRVPGTTMERECKHHGVTEFYVLPNKAVKCKRCNVERVQVRRERVSRTLKKEAGGKCVICGYNKCDHALDFHHIDPTKKDFEVNRRLTLAIDTLRKETEKCVLVCSNCHREIHAGLHPEYLIE